jgi:outer membrane protein assembly factor BamB
MVLINFFLIRLSKFIICKTTNTYNNWFTCSALKNIQAGSMHLGCCLILLLCFASCDSIDQKKILPSKKPLEVIVNPFQEERIFSQKITDLNLEETSNSGILFTMNKKQLFVGGSSGKIKSLDFAGKILWEKDLHYPITAGPVVFEQWLLVATSSAKLFCLDIQKGNQIWEISLGSDLLTAPTVTSDLIFIRTLDGSLTAINLKDGKHLWSYATASPTIKLRKGAAPALHKDRVIAGFGNGKIFAFDKMRGTVLWAHQISKPIGRSEFQRISDITADPLIVDDIVYAVSYNGNLVAIKVDTGDLLWEQEFSSYAGIAVNNQILYISTREGKVLAVNRTNGNLIWEQESLIGRNLSKPSIFQRYLIVGDPEGNLHFLNQKTGKLQGRVFLNSSGIFLVPLIINQNTLYALTNNGYLFIIKIS